jgi:hypothetical protein
MSEVTQKPPQSPQQPRRHTEPGDDLNTKAIIRVALILVCVVAVSAAIIFLLWREWRPGKAYGGPNAAMNFQVAQPVLESAPVADRQAYDADKARLLNSWQWIDPQAGIARIPVDQALRIMAERGGKPASSTSANARRQQ